MSQIQELLTRKFPVLAMELSTLPDEESSDSRWMQEFGSRVVAMYEVGQIEDIRTAFQLAEHLIESGTDEDRHLAIVGFLETIQNVASHREHGAKVFEEFLMPKSRIAWAELNEAWKGKSSLAEVVAAERGVSLAPRWWQFWRRRERRSPKELLGQVESPELRKIIEQMTRE